MNYDEISKEICRLAELTNNWSSTIIIPQGDAFLNISSAAQGKLSVTPDGATNQPNVYPKGQSPSVYRFDPDIFGERMENLCRATGVSNQRGTEVLG